MVPGEVFPTLNHDQYTERTMTTLSPTPACAGRERTCTQCGTTYRSPRNSSLYCSNACRQKAKRGTIPTGRHKADSARWTSITKALHKTGYVGCVGPWKSSDKAAPVYALLVPFEHALDELSFHFNRKGFGYITRDEFTEALRRDGVQDYHARSAEALDLNRRQTRRRMERARNRGPLSVSIHRTR